MFKPVSKKNDPKVAAVCWEMSASDNKLSLRDDQILQLYVLLIDWIVEHIGDRLTQTNPENMIY